MKGILFNHLEELITSELSQEVWQDLIEELPIETKERFVANRTYPDADLRVILEGFAQKAELDIPGAWRKFGKVSILNFMNKFPEFVQKYNSPKKLLEEINTLHFTDVREKFTETELPYFFVQDIRDDSLLLCYVSKRKMCFYLEGALEALKEYFQKPFSYRQIKCTFEGDEKCEIKVEFI
jgi:predicted hydrocarbon binding protein